MGLGDELINPLRSYDLILSSRGNQISNYMQGGHVYHIEKKAGPACANTTNVLTYLLTFCFFYYPCAKRSNSEKQVHSLATVFCTVFSSQTVAP